MFVQETGYLLRKAGGVNCMRRSFQVKRWMNKYMGLILQIAKEGHVRVCNANLCSERVVRERADTGLLNQEDRWYILYIIIVLLFSSR